MGMSYRVIASDGVGIVVGAHDGVMVFVHPVISIIGCRYAEAAADALSKMADLVCPTAGDPNITLFRVGRLDILTDTKRCIVIIVDNSVRIAELGEEHLRWIGYATSMMASFGCAQPTGSGDCVSLCSEVKRFVSESVLLLEMLR